MYVIASVVRREMSVVADTVLKLMCAVDGVVSSIIFAVADTALRDYTKLPV